MLGVLFYHKMLGRRNAQPAIKFSPKEGKVSPQKMRRLESQQLKQIECRNPLKLAQVILSKWSGL